MERWQNRVAVVTGASSGIGAIVAADLVKAGLVVVALARRESKLRENKNALPADVQSRYHPVRCDVTNEEEVKKVFSWVEKLFGGTDILVNNAGVFHYGTNLVDSSNSDAICKTLDTNVKALAFCVREAFNSMKNRKFDGHVILVNSVAGHTTERIPGTNTEASIRIRTPVSKEIFHTNTIAADCMYMPSKHAVTALAQTYRHEFAQAGTKVKITSISPGAVRTEILPEELLKIPGFPILEAEDISNAILYTLTTPPNVQIFELIIEAVGASMPNVQQKN